MIVMGHKYILYIIPLGKESYDVNRLCNIVLPYIDAWCVDGIVTGENGCDFNPKPILLVIARLLLKLIDDAIFDAIKVCCFLNAALAKGDVNAAAPTNFLCFNAT